MNPAGQPFWYALMLACITWYSTITIYVAVKGAFDIKHMLARLKNGGEDSSAEDRS